MSVRTVLCYPQSNSAEEGREGVLLAYHNKTQ